MLVGKTCTVRYFEAADLDRFIHLQAQPESRGPYFPSRFSSPVMLNKEFAETGFITADFERLAITTPDGALVGEIVHFKSRAPYVREMGYRLFSPVDHGKGIMTEATMLMADHLFRSNHMLQRLEILMATDNAGSKKVAQMAGFQKEGVLRDLAFFNGRFYDCYCYARLRRDPVARSAELTT